MLRVDYHNCTSETLAPPAEHDDDDDDDDTESFGIRGFPSAAIGFAGELQKFSKKFHTETQRHRGTEKGKEKNSHGFTGWTGYEVIEWKMRDTGLQRGYFER